MKEALRLPKDLALDDLRFTALEAKSSSKAMQRCLRKTKQSNMRTMCCLKTS